MKLFMYSLCVRALKCDDFTSLDNAKLVAISFSDLLATLALYPYYNVK